MVAEVNFHSKRHWAEAATMTGSCSFLNLHNNAMVIAAISAAGRSNTERFAITITEPVMAPMAAAVMPSTKASTPGSLPYFLKYGAGMVVNR